MHPTHALLLAHEGGWDEILFVVGPIVVLYLGLRWWEGRKSPESGRKSDNDAGS